MYYVFFGHCSCANCIKNNRKLLQFNEIKYVVDLAFSGYNIVWTELYTSIHTNYIKEDITMSYVDEVFDLVVAKNPAQPEFHQAVKEVLGCAS